MPIENSCVLITCLSERDTVYIFIDVTSTIDKKVAFPYVSMSSARVG